MYEDEYESTIDVYQDAFRDTQRIGHRRDMVTSIGGNNGKLSLFMDKINRADHEVHSITQLQEFYYSLSGVYTFGINDLETIIDIFQKTPHYTYKNIHAFVLGFILRQTGDIQIIQRILTHVDVQGISEIDVVRYSRLIESVTLRWQLQ